MPIKPISRTINDFCGLLPGLLLTAAGLSSAQATQVSMLTSLGEIRVDLHEDKPVTVGNFLAYINSGRYVSSFAHRLVPGFVLQGGGFTLQGVSVLSVPPFGPIISEYGVGQTRSNVFGTIAMAKLSSGPDPVNSATSQWFFNLGNNIDLDSQNGGFTVFGTVVAGLDVLTLFNTTFNQAFIGGRGVYNYGVPFDTLPLLAWPAAPSTFIYTNWSTVTATAYWVGAINAQWNQASNFATTSTGTYSIAGQVNATTDVVFNATLAANFANTQLGANQTIRTLTFTTPAAVGIGGTHTLTIVPGSASAGIKVGAGTGPVTHTISSSVALGAAQTWTVSDTGQTLLVSGRVSGGFGLNKAGAGILNLNGEQAYDALTATGGTTNVNGVLGTVPASGTANVNVSAGAKLKFGTVSQRLSSLTIGAGARVTFTGGAATGGFGGEEAGGKAVEFAGAAVVPEPGSVGLLLSGALGFCGRRRRA